MVRKSKLEGQVDLLAAAGLVPPIRAYSRERLAQELVLSWAGNGIKLVSKEMIREAMEAIDAALKPDA